MPEACFSYSTGSCFGYPTGASCFSYPAGPCFSYSTGAARAAGDLPGIFGGGGGPMGPCFSYASDGPRAGLRRPSTGTCFSYTGASTTHPDFTGGMCFRY